MRRTLGFVVLCATACDQGGAQGDADGNGSTCDIEVLTASPADGATDAFYETDVTFRLSRPDPTAVITVVVQASAIPVPGVSTVDGAVVTWTGSEPLVPEVEYVSRLSYACGAEDVQWQTSDAGGPVYNQYLLLERVYSIDLAEGQWVEPYGIGTLMNAILGGVEILVSPIDIGAEIELRGGLGDGTGEQDRCKPTVDFPPATFDNPSFAAQADHFDLGLGTTDAAIDDFAISGSFTPSGASIEGVSAGGSIDSRPLVPLIDGTTDDAFCQRLDETIHVQCEECADQSGPYCVTMLVDGITADQVGQQGLDARSPAAIAADQACDGL